MRFFIPVYLTSLASIVYGLWCHDWHTILAGTMLVLIFPFVMEGVDSVRHERVLDELWDDDDLSRSA